MRHLNKTVVSGGVVYPAGTAATPDLEKRVKNPAHWDGDPVQEPEQADVDPYKGWKVDQLKAEVTARNDATGEGEPQIEVAEPGNKPELLDALRADDAHRAVD